MKQKRIITKEFFIGNLGDVKATDEILTSYKNNLEEEIVNLSNFDVEAGVGENYEYNEKIRKCHVSWLNVSCSNFIEIGLRKIIENVNTIIWNFNLTYEWETNIQFTKYIGKGEHYDWHKDYYEEATDGIGFRCLSVVYCLSKKNDYTGGEFQIKTNNGGIYTTKFDYGDFIVFPSNKLHRVKPLKSGTRITMVGWYR